MDMTFTPEQIAFREEVRSWIGEAMPPEMRRRAENGADFEQSETMEWHKILYEKGWVAPHWPEEVGGTGWDITERFIFQEECVAANAPALSPFGLSMVGPLLIQFGSDEQKQRFLPKILSGDEIWCQGYSEPNAGSDLASLQMRAEKDGDDYILNGQKTWTTYAQYADWIFVLVRTSSEGKKQEGISFLLADVKNTPGITVKPFLTTGGTLAFSETWFKDAGCRRPTASARRTAAGPWPRRCSPTSAPASAASPSRAASSSSPSASRRRRQWARAGFSTARTSGARSRGSRCATGRWPC